MSEESTTRDLVELVRETVKAGGRGDLDALLTFYAPDAVWDMSNVGMGEFEGLAAIRGFLEDWLGSYEEMQWEAEEIRDLGNGITLAVVVQTGRPVGSTGEVQVRSAGVSIWTDGLVERVTNYADIDEGRAASERLAESRGYAMSRENVELVQRGLEYFMATGEPPWEMFDEEVEVYDHDTPDQGEYRGHAGYGRWLEDWGTAWAEWSIEPEEFIDAGESVVVTIRMKAKGRDSGIEVERQDALVYKIRNSKIVRCDYYNNRRQALEAVGLSA